MSIISPPVHILYRRHIIIIITDDDRVYQCMVAEGCLPQQHPPLSSMIVSHPARAEVMSYLRHCPLPPREQFLRR